MANERGRKKKVSVTVLELSTNWAKKRINRPVSAGMYQRE